jgi:hypothetical protein
MRSDGGVANGATVFLVLTAAENAAQHRSRLERILQRTPEGTSPVRSSAAALLDSVLSSLLEAGE